MNKSSKWGFGSVLFDSGVVLGGLGLKFGFDFFSNQLESGIFCYKFYFIYYMLDSGLFLGGINRFSNKQIKYCNFSFSFVVKLGILVDEVEDFLEDENIKDKYILLKIGVQILIFRREYGFYQEIR